MAIYHHTTKIIGRKQGRSATGSAAYRAGEKIVDRLTGLVFDYRKKGGCDDSKILAPKHAPSWVYDRSELWNRVEEKENRKDAQLTREVEFSLPVELTPDQMKELALAYVQEQFVDQGMIADIAFHKLTTRNPHCHVLLTMREIGPDGFGPKVRAWNEWALTDQRREAWATHANGALEKAGHTTRIDHRSLLDQMEEALDKGDMESAKALNRVPQVHEGYGPQAEWAQAENIERMGQTWKLREEWDAIEKKAWAEARLMASASDQTPTKETNNESQQRTTQPTGRWKRTPRIAGRTDTRHFGPPVTHGAIHPDRLRRGAIGEQLVPQMSGSNRDAVEQSRWRPKRDGDPLRRHEQGHRRHREAVHFAQGITRDNLYSRPLSLSVNGAPTLRMPPTTPQVTAVQRPTAPLNPSPSARPKGGRPSLPRKSKSAPSASVGRVKHNRITVGINASEHDRMMAEMANQRMEMEEAAASMAVSVAKPHTTDEDVRAWASRKMDINAIQWHDADLRMQQAQRWLTTNKDEGPRRRNIHDTAQREYKWEWRKYEMWLDKHPEPKRHFWNKKECATWDQAHTVARAPMNRAHEKYEDAKALTSMIAHRTLEQERTKNIQQQQRALEQRRAIKMLPSELAEQKIDNDFKFPPRPEPTTDDLRELVKNRNLKPNSAPPAFKPKGM